MCSVPGYGFKGFADERGFFLLGGDLLLRTIMSRLSINLCYVFLSFSSQQINKEKIDLVLYFKYFYVV